MMISPKSYLENIKEYEYLELIKERNNLMDFIKGYEVKDIEGDRFGDEWLQKPGPDVQYQMYLEYLSELCLLMSERYNRDYVWGDRRLKDDAKKQEDRGDNNE